MNRMTEQEKQDLVTAIEAIQSNALSGKVSHELTYQQAFSIHLRSKELAEDTSFHSLSPEKKAEQINLCWEWRNRR